MSWLNEIDNGLPEPYLVLYLHNSVQIKSKEIYETKEFKDKVKRCYETLFTKWIKIDTSNKSGKLSQDTPVLPQVVKLGHAPDKIQV